MKSIIRKTVSARLSSSLAAQLATFIEASGRTQSDIVTEAMTEYLEKSKLRVGSVSHGTQRRQDLIPAFCAHLMLVDEHLAERTFREFFSDEGDELRALWQCAQGHAAWPEDSASSWDIVDLHYFEMNLLDALGETALNGMYFGAHPGDGSDYGYWATEE